MRRSHATSALFAILLVAAGSAAAQPPSGPPEQVERRTARLSNGALARLVTRSTPDERTSGATLAFDEAAPTRLIEGGTAAAIERGERVTIVAYESSDRARPFRYRVVRAEGDDESIGDEQHLARPGSRARDIPFAVAIAPIPDRGFAIFYEELQSDDPSAARTYLFLLDRDGAPIGEGHEIQVPWPIAAAAWNGRGFHLALIYPGGGAGVRLSMVSLTTEGSPEQHPDWSSTAGFVSDVHLVVSGGHVLAHYHGGSGGDRWLESDVTAIRSWGSEPPQARDHGAIDLDTTLVVGDAGRVEALPLREARGRSTSRR